LIRTLLARLLPCTFALAVLVYPCASRAADKGQLDADPALFTVLAALNAAGYDADLNSTANHPLRNAVREYLKGRNIPSLSELKLFVASHKMPDSNAEVSQYVSYALSIDGPPDFGYRYPMSELAPDVMRLDGLAPVLARFYKEADLETVWNKSQPAFAELIEAYQEPVSRAVMQANAYLRNPTSGYLGRRFQIYLDLLGPPNEVHTRSYKDDYFIVISPSREMRTEDIRHAYLHYLLDPLVLKFAESMSHARGLADFAEAAPALPESYKTDFTLLATECLIKAVETRLMPANKREAVVNQALREGFVMTPAFAEGLPAYEKQQQALRLYFPDMVKAIDLHREEVRLSQVQFVRDRAVATIKAPPPPPEPKVELTGPQKELAAADALYTERKLDAAKEAFSRLLQTTPDRAIHSRAYYGLARIAVLQREPEIAEKLFRRTLELDPDPEVRGWSLVYLGRLFDAEGEREQATVNYKAALAVEGVSPGARQAAEKGLKESFTKPK
jgi:tetratricopeptide (TPR) repeat protein